MKSEEHTSKSKLDILLIIAKVLLILSAIILTYVTIVCFLIFRDPKTPTYIYIGADYRKVYNILLEEKEKLDIEEFPSKSEYRKLVADEMGSPIYFYKEKNMGQTYNGVSYIPIRLMIVDNRLKDERYCEVFTHELIHLTKFLKNERQVSFDTFKFLYESENPYLKSAGIYSGLDKLCNRYPAEYECTDLIIHYLLNK